MTFALRWVPHREHDGIKLIVAHRWLKAGASRIFDRTSEALTIAAADAPTAYAAFQRDVRQIVVTLQPVATPFQRFQMAVVAPAPIALQTSLPEYITWLLHTSAFMHGPDEAHRRTAEFLASLRPDERIRVSAWPGLEGALIGTGFPYRSNVEWLPKYMPMLQAVMENTAGVRRPGSAALDLGYVAAGRLDGFWEFGLSVWDIAAGALLIREAGGIIASLTPGRDALETGNVIAGSPKVFDPLQKLLAPHL